ncbi:MAG: hypothetical protein LBG60_11585 [Bifidobacteriaceae bacterium]|nr:hypothetical protein [Bifidobacteriaceae bacterium]
MAGDRQARLFEDQVAHAISAPRFGPYLEPVFKVSALRRQVRNMRLVMRSIDPALEDWLNAVSRIDSVLAQAPSAPGSQ